MNVTSAAPVFQVSDLARALAFYQDVLGFEREFIYGDPPRYASVQRNGHAIHLSVAFSDDKSRRLGLGSVYHFCDEVDEYYREIVARGAGVTSPLGDQPYDMRDFQIRDPDGNLLGFGAPVR